MRVSLAVVLALCGLMFGCAEPQKKSAPDQNIHYILGGSYLQEGNASRALQEFHKALEADPGNVDILIVLGRAYQMKGAYAEAENVYLQALRLRSDDPLIENNLGSLYLDMQRQDDAIHYFRKAADNLMFPKAEVSLTGLGIAYFQKREYDKAIDAYRKALEQNSRYDEAHFRLGEAYGALAKPELALGEFRQAVRLNGNHVRAHFQLALSYMNAKIRPKRPSTSAM